MKRLTIFLLICLSLAVASTSARTIAGCVASAADSTWVGGAMCKLMSDDKLLSEATTNGEGAFAIATDIRDMLKLEIGMDGYSSTEIVIKEGNKDIDLGIIFIDKGVELNEVTVTTNQVLHPKGRTIVYPSASEVKASSTSIELFQKLPLAGLTVNPIFRTMSVDGGSPYILINGRPGDMTEIHSLPPKDIEKIEFTRITPARYAGKGNGVINIILKKRDDGGSIYAWGRSAVQTAFVDANINASYHQGPSQFSIFYSPSWRNYQKVYDFREESYIAPDFRVDLKSSDRNPFSYVMHPVNLKYDYSPNLNTLLSATFKAMPSKQKNRLIGHFFDSELGEYDSHNPNRTNVFAPSLDLFFRRQFNSKNSIEVQVVGTLNSSDYRRDNKYTYPDGKEQIYTSYADSRRRSLISEVTYIHDFSDKTQLSGGIQNTLSHSENKYLDTGYKPVLTENNNYVYASLGQSVGQKVYLTLSTGLMMYWLKNDMNKRHYTRNTSRAQISWYINQKWNLQGAFIYGSNIPSLSALTDNPQQVSQYLVSNGNPNLKVLEQFIYMLTASYNYKKFNASFTSRYSNMINGFFTHVSYIGNGLFLRQSINSRYQRYFSNSLSLQVNDISGFGANLSLEVTHCQSAVADWSRSLTSFSANFTLWWNKGPFTISYWRKFPGKYINAYSVGKDENGDALQLQYKPNKHWNLGVSWMYMFDKKGTRYPSWNYSPVNPSYIKRNIENNSNMVVLSATYNTDFGSIFRTARRSLNNSDNGSSLLQQ